MRLVSLIAVAGLLSSAPYGAAQEATAPTLQQQIDSLDWRRPPGTCQIAAVAIIVPDGSLQCLSSAETRRFLEINGNPPTDNNYTLAPTDGAWFAIFSFEASGYVTDNEQLDPDVLLQKLKDVNKQGQAKRRQLQLEVLTLVDWYVPPHYNIQTKQLEWGTRLRGEKDEEILNYTIRILGRSGVMSAVLVSDPSTFDRDLISFRRALRSFHYISGENYEEFRQGDRVAEYGLSALIVGGAAAVAAKSGFGKFIAVMLAAGAKAIFAVFVAAIAAIGAVFRKIFGRITKSNTPQ